MKYNFLVRGSFDIYPYHIFSKHCKKKMAALGHTLHSEIINIREGTGKETLAGPENK